MKNECDIVGDLLFSYHDGVLSNSSKELVEEHLAKCEKCKTILAELTQEDTKKSQTKEVDFLKRIQKSSNKKNILIAVVCILFFVLVLFHLLVYNNYYEIASTMEVYLDNDITEQQIEDIKNKIIENSYNLELEYVSKEAAQNRIKDNLGETYDLNKYFDNIENIVGAGATIYQMPQMAYYGGDNIPFVKMKGYICSKNLKCKKRSEAVPPFCM